jgi:SOS-response transcriptional repressor LexA
MLTHDQILDELRRWIDGGKVTQKEVADELGVKPPRINEVLNGKRKIQPREMPVLAHYLDMTKTTNSTVRQIKRIGLVPAGSLREALAEATGVLDVSASLPSGVFALKVDGESMNKVAPFGADVIVDPDDKSLFAGDLYVVGDGAGDVTFKRFMQDPARLVPMSDDPSFTDIALGSQPVEIIGRVVSVALGLEHLRRAN